MGYGDSGAPGGILSSMPVIVSTLDGRIHGVLCPASHESGGLVVLADTDAASAASEQMLHHLGTQCQRAGISMLQISYPFHVPLDTDRHSLNLLATVSFLRSHGIHDVAVIFCRGQQPSPLAEIRALSFKRCVEIARDLAADGSNIGKELATLTDSIRSASNCIRGITDVCIPRQRQDVPATIQARADALYNWAVTTLYLRKAGISDSATELSQESTDQSPAERKLNDLREQMDRLQREAARARNLAQQNYNFLQEQWDALLNQLGERDSTRAALVRAQCSTAGHRNSTAGHRNSTAVLETARISWRYLDRSSRDQWLEAWVQVFPFAGL